MWRGIKDWPGGARVVGIDNSKAQLATARRLQRQHELDFPLARRLDPAPTPVGFRD